MSNEFREDLLETIDKLYKRGSYEHALNRYVNRSYWTAAIKSSFPNYHLDNTTDFNYGTCFSYYLNLSDTDATIGSEKSREFVKKNGVLYRLLIQISVIAPYAVCAYEAWQMDEEDGIRHTFSYHPLKEEHRFIGKTVEAWIEDQQLILLPEELLSIIIPGVSLELKESDATVYHCLFEDGYF